MSSPPAAYTQKYEKSTHIGYWDVHSCSVGFPVLGNGRLNLQYLLSHGLARSHLLIEDLDLRLSLCCAAHAELFLKRTLRPSQPLVPITA
jgi:hypothetical protein